MRRHQRPRNRRPSPGAIAAALAAALALSLAAALAWVLACEERASPAPGGGSSTELAAADAGDGFPEVDWDHWLSVNPDVVGWVTVPSTRISQPIVQAPASDPTYYLEHDVYRQYNPMGCPYLDAGCEEGLSSTNAVVFGHHWSGGRVFSDFELYGRGSFAEENRLVLLQTPSEKRRLHVQAVEVTRGSAETKVTSFPDRGAFEAWWTVRYAASQAKVAPDPEDAGFPERVVTFCTCSYAHRNDRTLVYASDELP